jgi:hypothetical protein
VGRGHAKGGVRVVRSSGQWGSGIGGDDVWCFTLPGRCFWCVTRARLSERDTPRAPDAAARSSISLGAAWMTNPGLNKTRHRAPALGSELRAYLFWVWRTRSERGGHG